jgi:hypothetical protein
MLLAVITFFAGLALLLAALALPLRLAAQDKQDHNHRHASYAITVLGTLDGRRSIGNGLNNRGQVADFATTPGDTAGRAVLWSQRVITDLGTLGLSPLGSSPPPDLQTQKQHGGTGKKEPWYQYRLLTIR